MSRVTGVPRNFYLLANFSRRCKSAIIPEGERSHRDGPDSDERVTYTFTLHHTVQQSFPHHSIGSEHLKTYNSSPFLSHTCLLLIKASIMTSPSLTTFVHVRYPSRQRFEHPPLLQLSTCVRVISTRVSLSTNPKEQNEFIWNYLFICFVVSHNDKCCFLSCSYIFTHFISSAIVGASHPYLLHRPFLHHGYRSQLLSLVLLFLLH